MATHTINACSHPIEAKCNDQRTGDTICMQCALVLEERYSMSSFSNGAYIPPLHISKDSATKRVKDGEEDIYALADLMHVTDSIRDDALSFYDKHIYNKQLRSNELALYSLFYAKIRNGVNCTIQEMCTQYGFGISPSSLWKIEKRLCSNEDDSGSFVPSDFIPRYCSMLNIYFYAANEICEKADKEMETTSFSFAPQTIAVACIFYYVRDKQMNHIALKDLCNLASVSTTAVRRAAAKLWGGWPKSNKEKRKL